MIKSELVQRISMASAHLYRRDAEKVVNAILDEITTAMARGDRVELRGQAPPLSRCLIEIVGVGAGISSTSSLPPFSPSQCD